jgi:sugar phosphate isomerase/epimerase
MEIAEVGVKFLTRLNLRPMLPVSDQSGFTRSSLCHLVIFLGSGVGPRSNLDSYRDIIIVCLDKTMHLGEFTMSRPVTLFTGQWADLPLEVICQKASKWGYEGIELPCWGDHFNVQKALDDEHYCKGRHELLGKYGLKVWAISNHLVGQAVCDVIDERHKLILPEHVWGDGKPEGVKQRAAKEMMDTARAAQKLGIKVVNGFTGSSIWHLLYSFPPVSDAMIAAGFKDLADRWNPILDVFKQCGIKFGLEVHPTEIAFDIYSAEMALKALDHRPEFGFNFDPSHLLWQFVDSVEFIRAFPGRIYHMHVKDAARTLNGKSGILGSHLNFGDPRRGWDFRSPGRGQVDFDAIARALNEIGYTGPMSVEWEDPGMDREYGAAEAARFVKEKMGFKSAGRLFDQAFAEGQAKK